MTTERAAIQKAAERKRKVLSAVGWDLSQFFKDGGRIVEEVACYETALDELSDCLCSWRKLNGRTS